MTTVLDELECYTSTNCPDYDGDLLSRILVLSRFTALFLTLLLYAVGIWYRDIYLQLFGFSMTIATFVNVLFREAIGQVSPTVGCGDEFGMPSGVAQHAMFFYMFVVTYVAYWGANLGTVRAVLLVLFGSLACFGQVYLGYNTVPQVVVGSVVGIVLAIILQHVLSFAIQPHFELILRWPVVAYFRYTNGLCKGNGHKKLLEHELGLLGLRHRIWEGITDICMA